MKNLPIIFCLFIGYAAVAQKGDELLVYSLKGNVTVIENSKESKVKIGKVLKPGSTIKTEKLSKLTMVCKEGKPLTVTKEGSFPVTGWKDSCGTESHNSMTSKYFQYIWDQLYVRSEDYQKEHSGDIGGVVRSDAPIRGEEELEILIDEGLDTVKYATGNFPLSWTTNIPYSGKYYVSVTDLVTGKKIYGDSIADKKIRLAAFKQRMKAGNVYQWSVATKQTGVYNGGVIKYVPVKIIGQQITKFQKMVDVPEDAAAQYFRIAYLLQNDHYLGDALLYYQKAVKAAPTEGFYTEKFGEFKSQFKIN